jgi:hypothetical protein
MFGRYATPETIFALIRQDSYPRTFKQNCCAHYFIFSQQNGTDQARFICKNCFLHFENIVFDTGKECADHFYCYTTTEDRHTTLCALCVKCSRGCQFRIKERSLEEALFRDLFEGKDIATQANAVLMLIFYCGNILHGELKPINAENQKFQQNIGINNNSLSLLARIGYELVDGYFIPIEHYDRSELEFILEELSLMSEILQLGDNSRSIYTFADGTRQICENIGIKYSHGQTMKEFLESFSSFISKTTHSYSVLGCTSHADTHMLISCYKILKQREPNSLPRLIDALIEISQSGINPELDEFIAIELSNGVVTESDLRNAFNILGLNMNDSTHSSVIIEVYNRLCLNAPASTPKYRNALKTIASHRDCVILQHYLTTGKLIELDMADSLELLEMYIHLLTQAGWFKKYRKYVIIRLNLVAI